VGRPKTTAPKPSAAGRRYLLLAGIVLLAGLGALAGWRWWPVEDGPPRSYEYEVVNTYPHDAGAFTQGLIFHNGRLFEGTGLYGQSTLREVDLATGGVLRQVPLSPELFGEGITLLDGSLFQLTYQEKVAIEYDPANFKERQRFNYEDEGWGLTHDGKHLIMSDGSSTLRFLDPKTFSVLRRVEVKDGNASIKDLNELEWVNGEIWANIWRSDRIARIKPDTGRVVGWINLKGLMPSLEGDTEAVLNGIAYDPKEDRLFVTGKRWPSLFEIKIKPRSE